ncbi:hypothetical protein [Treponema sp.]|uniref:hypothetical protein n=1 Tax=Treponema sp. TaxID=166 RepID=UPI003FD742CA
MNKKIFFVGLCLFAFSLFSCDPPEAFFKGITFPVICLENDEKPVSNVYVNLRNDSLSNKVLAHDKTDSKGVGFIVFVRVPDINGKYSYLTEAEYRCEDLSPIDAQIDSSGKTDFYIVVNDRETEYYNPKYETKILYLNEFNDDEFFEKTVYLSAASDEN